MTTYRILIESMPGEFTNTGQTLDAEPNNIVAILMQWQTENHVCYAAEKIAPVAP